MFVLKQVNSTGVMVALMLPPDAAAKLALPEGEPPEALHITLAYMGKVDAFTPDALELIKKVVTNFVEQSAPVSGVVSGVGVFSQNETDRVVYASFDSPGLGEFRHNLVSALHSADLPVSHEHSFTPHITLAYTTRDELNAVPDIPQFPIIFQSVTCVKGPDREDYPLAGTSRFMQQTVRLAKRIVRRGDKWCVTTQDGSRTLGCHDTKEDAIRQLAAVEVNKRLSPKKQKEYDEETERIRQSKKTPEAMAKHKFAAAQFTHPNMHPRCKICGGEESMSGFCNAPELDEQVNVEFSKYPIDGPMSFDERLRLARQVLKATLTSTDVPAKPPQQGCLPRDPQCPDRSGRTAMAAPIDKDWFEKFHDILPLSGQPLAFVLQARFKGLKPEQMSQSLSDLVEAKSEMSFVLRFASDRIGGYWGFEVEGNAQAEAWPATAPGTLKAIGPMNWMTASDIPVFKTGDRFIKVDSGTYQLVAAAADAVELQLSSPLMSGRYFWRRIGDGWLLEKVGEDAPSLTSGDFGDLVAKSVEAGFEHIVWPKNIVKIKEGHEVVSVAEASAQLSRYKVIKAAGEQRYTLGVAYPAAELDLHKDFMDAEDLERTAWDAMRRGVKIGLMHRAGTGGAGQAVESYIYRGPDWKVDDQIVRSGDWLLGVVWDENAWSAIKSGQLKGFSLQGWARKIKNAAGEVVIVGDS